MENKVQELEAEIGRLYMNDTQLTSAKNHNLQLLQSKLNELSELKKEQGDDPDREDR